MKKVILFALTAIMTVGAAGCIIRERPVYRYPRHHRVIIVR